MSGERVDAVCSGVVLAAGMSTRMGQNKLLLPLGGEPLVRRVVAAALDAGLDPVLVVTGFEADRVRQALHGLRFQEVVNEAYARGMNGSVTRGIRAVPPEAAAAAVILGDMPFVTVDMLEELVRQYRETAAPLIASRYGAVVGPPMVYDRSLFPEFTSTAGDGCGRRMVQRHAEVTMLIDWPADRLADIDTPEDRNRVSSRLAIGG